MRILLLLWILSTSAFAQRLCPRGYSEIVACKEQGIVSVSACQNEAALVLVTQEGLQRARFFSAVMEETTTSWFFESKEAEVELIVPLGRDDHAQGSFWLKDSRGVREFNLRCLTRR
jgi:hypothetical protein